VLGKAGAEGDRESSSASSAESARSDAEAASGEPTAAAAPAPPAFDASLYAGLYQSVWAEAAIMPWEGGLAIMPLPGESLRTSLEKFRHVAGHTFRRVRDDGELGEEARFEVDATGRVVRVRRHGNAMEKVQ
jgi:hypothetical protein